MEVLFNVPMGPDGDANQDGVRDATGDEFIELMNHHNRPINLAGYVLTDRHEEGPRQMRFEFPDVELAPGAIAVVFNGHRAAIPGPIGTSDAAPDRGNDRFGGALVFSMEIASRARALANAADALILRAPDGRAVEVVFWGSPDPAPPADAMRTSEVPSRVRGSVQRLTPDGDLIPHDQIDGALFSPGVIPRPAPQSPDTLESRESRSGRESRVAIPADHPEEAPPRREE